MAMLVCVCVCVLLLLLLLLLLLFDRLLAAPWQRSDPLLGN
jgi:hypothetical protein